MRILRITPTNASLADVDGSLATLQAIIGGDIQWIPLGHDSAMYAHENGKYLNLPENPIATRLYACTTALASIQRTVSLAQPL